MQIRPNAFTIGLIIYFSIALFLVYTEFGIDSPQELILPLAAPNVLVMLFHYTFIIIYTAFLMICPSLRT